MPDSFWTVAGKDAVHFCKRRLELFDVVEKRLLLRNVRLVARVDVRKLLIEATAAEHLLRDAFLLLTLLSLRIRLGRPRLLLTLFSCCLIISGSLLRGTPKITLESYFLLPRRRNNGGKPLKQKNPLK